MAEFISSRSGRAGIAPAGNFLRANRRWCAWYKKANTQFREKGSLRTHSHLSSRRFVGGHNFLSQNSQTNDMLGTLCPRPRAANSVRSCSELNSVRSAYPAVWSAAAEERRCRRPARHQVSNRRRTIRAADAGHEERRIGDGGPRRCLQHCIDRQRAVETAKGWRRSTDG